jgi:hypothetical protein
MPHDFKFRNFVASSVPTFCASGYESDGNRNCLSITPCLVLPISCPMGA